MLANDATDQKSEKNISLESKSTILSTFRDSQVDLLRKVVSGSGLKTKLYPFRSYVCWQKTIIIIGLGEGGGSVNTVCLPSLRRSGFVKNFDFWIKETESEISKSTAAPG
jgi:hypothetical protein